MILSHILIKWRSMLKTSNVNNISLIFGIGYGYPFNFLFRSPPGLADAKDGATHSEYFATSRTPSRNILSTSFLNISLCTFSNGYFYQQIGFASSFNSKYTGSVSQAPSVPPNNSLNFCNYFINSLHFVIVKCWHWFSTTLCKSDF